MIYIARSSQDSIMTIGFSSKDPPDHPSSEELRNTPSSLLWQGLKWNRVRGSVHSFLRFKHPRKSKRRSTPPFIKSPNRPRAKSTAPSTESSIASIANSRKEKASSRSRSGSKSDSTRPSGRLRVASLEPLKVKTVEDFATGFNRRYTCCPRLYRVRRGVYCLACCRNDIVQIGLAHVLLVAAIVFTLLALGEAGIIDVNTLCFWKNIWLAIWIIKFIICVLFSLLRIIVNVHVIIGLLGFQ